MSEPLMDDLFDEPLDVDDFLYDLTYDHIPAVNQGMAVPEQEEGAPETVEVVRRRAKKGKRIGVVPPPVDEDVIISEGQVGPESLEEHEKKARADQDAPPRN